MKLLLLDNDLFPDLVFIILDLENIYTRWNESWNDEAVVDEAYLYQHFFFEYSLSSHVVQRCCIMARFDRVQAEAQFTAP